MMKVAIVISKLEVGGIPSALCALLNEINGNEALQIDLFLFRKNNTSRFSIPEGIHVIYPSRVLECWHTRKKECDKKYLFFWYLLHFIGLKISMGIVEKLAFREKKYEGYDVAIAYENDIAAPKMNFMVNDFVLECIQAKKSLVGFIMIQ